MVREISMKHVTISDIARETNFSKSTVSAALNGKPGISEKNRKFILDTAKRMGYMPSELARGLAMKQSNTIGVVVNDITNPFFNLLVKAIEKVADRYGFTLLLSNTDFNHKKEVNSVRTLLGKRVEGMIITPMQRNVDISHLIEVRRYGIPMCVVGKVPGFECYSVDQNDYKGSVEVMEYLFKMGHRHIAHISGPDFFNATSYRFKAYCDSLKAHNIPYDSNLVIQTNSGIEYGYQVGDKLESMSPRPTAVFCFDDQIAKGLFKYYAEKKLPIPEHISIVGFNDSVDYSSILTTVHVPIYEMGLNAAEYLFKCINKRCISDQKNVVFPTQLAIRQSVYDFSTK